MYNLLNSTLSALKKCFFALIFLFSFQKVISQTTIVLSKKGGVYEIPCKINGKSVGFIFDSGAADVAVSLEFFKKGLDLGYFKPSDLTTEIRNYQIANGEISRERIIKIRELVIGDLVLYNVKASLSEETGSPMLLGQSALERFGEYSFNYEKSTLTILGNAVSNYEKKLSKYKNTPYGVLAEDYKTNASIAKNLECELISIKEIGEQIQMNIDITNPTSFSYTQNFDSYYRNKSTIIVYSVEVTTADGKRYTSNDNMMSSIKEGQTLPVNIFLDIRKKVPANITAYFWVKYILPDKADGTPKKK